MRYNTDVMHALGAQNTVNRQDRNDDRTLIEGLRWRTPAANGRRSRMSAAMMGWRPLCAQRRLPATP
jgi:hypothetical protein